GSPSWERPFAEPVCAVDPRRYGAILRRMGVFPAPSGQGLLPHRLYLLPCYAEAGHPEGLYLRSAFCPSGLHKRAVEPDLSVASPNKGLQPTARSLRLRSGFRQRLKPSVRL